MPMKQLLLTVLLALACATTQAKDQTGTPVFRADYENRELTSGVAGLAADGPAAKDALEIDCSVGRTGKCSLQSRVRMRDDYISGGAFRAETSTSRIPGTLYSPGDRFRYRFSLLIDKGWQADTRDAIDMVWQFKRFSTHPDMFIAIKGETLVWRISDQKQITLAKALPRGEWVDFDFVVKWSIGDDGLAELTLTQTGSGKTDAFKYAGPNLRDAKPRGGYLKWGLYKPGQKQRQEPFPVGLVHHDDVEVDRLP